VGKAFIFPLLFQFDQYFSIETFEVAGLDHKYNAILPWWWIVKYLPGNLFVGDVYFHSDNCKKNCTHQVATPFLIEYNQSVLEWGDQIYTCGSVSMILEGTKDNTLREVKKQIPEIYWEFAEAFTEKQSDKLSPHQTYNHKIDLLAGQ
jgi:hypothetical protein